jgi:poly(A)-specific ribonuclease
LICFNPTFLNLKLKEARMEITQDNFVENLKLIEDSIDQADFISIDLEFSGYTAGPDDKEHEYDSVEERYQKIRSVINKFVAFQIGICCFKFEDSTKKYIYRPFNFYVWPKSKIKD